MGKRQRDSAFVNHTDEEVAKLARDTKLPTELRRRAVAEEKFRKRRNRQKRSK